MMPKARGLLALFIFLLSLTGCEVPTGEGAEGDTIVDIQPGDPEFDPQVTVCNPFEDDVTAANRGIVGEIKYISEAQRAEPGFVMPSRVEDFLAIGQPIDVTLFFSRMYVPTRPFDRGFRTQSGAEVLTENGDTLYEWFALDMRTQLKLGAADAPGFYQLALLSDDGAILDVESESGSYTIVDNDGTHPTRMGCATEPVYIGPDTKLKVRLRYYQGPRYHISNVVMWRPWPEDGTEVDPLCGRKGNSLFFDSTQDPVTPQPSFYELTSRGWRVLENDNYALLDDISSNPCTPAEELLTMSGVMVSTISQTSAVVTWTTNLPADSYVLVTNLSTGVQSEVHTLDLVLDHSVELTGLTANTLYSLTVSSTSAGGQVVSGDQYGFKTRR